MTDYSELLRKKIVDNVYESKGNDSYLHANMIADATRQPHYSGSRANLLPPEERSSINNALKELQNKGLIEIYHDKQKDNRNYEVYGARINKDAVKKLFPIYGITAKDEADAFLKKQIEIMLMTENLTDKTKSYLKYVISNPFGKQSIWQRSRKSGILDSERGFELIRGADAVLRCGQKNKSTLIRNVSISTYGDSKRFQQIEDQICTSIEKILLISGNPEELAVIDEAKNSSKKIYEFFGVSKNPFSEIIKGSVKIITDNGKIDTCGHTYSFRSDEEDGYRHIYIEDKNLITIENITTYSDFDKPGYAKIFTRGYPSPFMKRIIRKIVFDNPQLVVKHWSDIDVGGFNIFYQIYNCSEKKAVPYRMDAEEIRKTTIRKDLTDWDRKNLSKYITDPFFGNTAEYMLKYGEKVEQEAEKISIYIFTKAERRPLLDRLFHSMKNYAGSRHRICPPFSGLQSGNPRFL